MTEESDSNKREREDDDLDKTQQEEREEQGDEGHLPKKHKSGESDDILPVVKNDVVNNATLAPTDQLIEKEAEQERFATTAGPTHYVSASTRCTQSENSPLSGSPPTNKPADPAIAAKVTNPNSVVEERAEISAQYVGKVIGKGGEMLRDLQARSGCRLDVDQNVPQGNPRILTYRGTRKTVDLAKQMVSVLCTPQGNEGSLPLGEASRKDLIVPASSVGKIIGRAGEMVRELQSRSQAKIQVDHTSKGFKSETRSVSIIGTHDAVAKAEEMVLFLVANPLLDAMKAIRMLVDEKQKTGQRWGSGPPYFNLPNHGHNMQPTEHGYAGSVPVQQPPQHGVFYGAQPQGGPPQAHGGYSAPLPSQQQSFDPYYNGGAETEIFPAAKMYMGRVIGQKGVTINDLQKRSGCDIQINQDVPPGQDCIITIKGARPGIENAKLMLREIIEMGPNHPYAGGGGQYQGQGYQHQQPTPYVQHPAVHMGFQAHGHQIYGHQQAPYGIQPTPQQYAPVQANYGIPPYQQQGYQSQGLSGYIAHQPRQQLPRTSVPISAWKSATAADGQVYYYNEKTGETQWDKPHGMP